MRRFPWVYGMRSGAYIKIGASGDIELRLKEFQLGNPHRIAVVLRQMCDEGLLGRTQDAQAARSI